MLRLGLSLFWWLLVFGAEAQHWGHSRNPVHPPKNFDWVYYSTPHFDVHYYGRLRIFGDKVARTCEQAYYELNTRLDFLPETRIRVFLFNSPLDYFQETSGCMIEPAKNNGVTHPTQPAAYVCYDSQQQNLYGNIKTQIIRVYIKQLMSGGLMQNILHNDLTFFLLDWYLEGLSAYLGFGWTSTDEMMLRSIDLGKATQMALQKPAHPAAMALRKSIWRFIEKQYGVSKVSDIIYMTMVARSVESGIMAVLGVNMAEFTQRWETFLVYEYGQNSTVEITANQYFKSNLPLPKNSRLIAHALSPNGKTTAALLETNEKIRLWLFSSEKNTWEATPIVAAGSIPKIIHNRVFFPLVFSPDGKTILGTLPRKHSWELFYYQQDNKTIYRSNLQKQLDWINQIAVSPDQSSLVFSGSLDGQVDLFRANWQSETVVPLTKDLFWESHPVFAQDGKSLFFASNRGGADTFSLKQVQADADIFRLTFNHNEPKVERVVLSPLSYEYPVAVLSPSELLIRSDASGLFQLVRYDIAKKTWNFVTNIREGILEASYAVSKNQLSIATFFNQQQQIFQQDSFSTTGFRAIQPTKFALQRMSDADALILKQREDSLEAVRDSILAAKSTYEEKVDSNSRKINTRYYVFDEEDNDSTHKDRRTYAINRKKKKNQPPGNKIKTLFDPNYVQVISPRRYQPYPSKIVAGTTFEMDPFFKFRAPNFIELSDPFMRYQVRAVFTPYIDFRSSDMGVNGSWFTTHWAWQAGADKMSRYFKDPTLRYNAIRGWLGFSRILSPYQSVGISLETTFFDRLDLRIHDNRQLDGKATNYGARLKYQFDNTVRSKYFQLIGTQAKVEAVSQLNTNYKNLYFTTLSGDIRHYQPVLGAFTLALRMSAGVSFGLKPQHFFLGGWDNWINREFQNEGNVPIAQEVPEFYYSQAMTPIRGLPFNARNGKQYLLANVELRLPLVGTSRHKLSHKFPYNLQWITFYDVGTAWKTGNPFSQRNPIDVEYAVRPPLTVSVQSLKSPFLQSFGTGFRALILGYSMRADVAWGGIEDNTILTPKVGITIGYDF